MIIQVDLLIFKFIFCVFSGSHATTRSSTCNLSSSSLISPFIFDDNEINCIFTYSDIAIACVFEKTRKTLFSCFPKSILRVVIFHKFVLKKCPLNKVFGYNFLFSNFLKPKTVFHGGNKRRLVLPFFSSYLR